jgi:formylglycine-generating enzyme required for sulfatase activity
MTDHDSFFDLQIRLFAKQSDGYRVEISGPEYGPVGGQFDDSLLKEKFGPSPAADGDRLFMWLFSDQKVREAWQHLRGAHPGRRVRLFIDSDAPELHALPWETFVDSSIESKPFIAAAGATPFSRYLAGGFEPTRPVNKLPVRILVAISNPDNLARYKLAPIDEEKEWTAIEKTLDELMALDMVELKRLESPCTLGRLEAELKQGYHILHFIGHGQFGKKGGQPALFMAGDENKVKLIFPDDFAGMLGRQLEDTVEHQNPLLRLVFLASCESAKRSSGDAFRGIAPQLIARSLPAVIAMQDLVDVTTAREFATVFYRQLLAHGLVDLAGNEARSALLTTELPGAAIPVLFSRLPGGRLIDVTSFEPPKPRQRGEPETVRVTGGAFEMGADGLANGLPSQKVTLQPYRIGRYPVTNEEYAEFLKRNPAHDKPAGAGWFGFHPPQGKERHPVVKVSWHDALAYCRWLSEVTERPYRLPTEAEWEKAARGPEGQPYPWGDTWLNGRCNVGNEETCPVDAYPSGSSPYGCEDMLGNVQEWTSTLWGSDLDHSDFSDVYDAGDGREEIDTDGNQPRAFRIHRGGHFKNEPENLQNSIRGKSEAGSKFSRRGFRISRDA